MRRRDFVLLALCAGVGLPLAGLLLTGCNSSTDSTATVTRIRGGGATFVNPIMREWAKGYFAAREIEIDYQAKGSGAGLQQMTAKTYDFGCSDAPMKKQQLEKAIETGGEVIHIPLIMGPVVAAYNVPGLDKPLVFSGPVLADIYLGKITKWNDPALKKLNPDAPLPDLAIAPVFRAEASGTTNIFKEYLAKSSPEFKEKVGVSTEPTWPRGIGSGERESLGVVNFVKKQPGAIGYVEISFAKSVGVPYGAVRNRAGKEVTPSAAGVTAAAAAAMKVKQETEPYSLHEQTFSLTDADGDASYPISGMTYCVIYKKQKAAMGKALKEFLRWITHEGQGAEYAEKLDYAPLPAELVKQIETRLNQIEMTP